MLGAVACFDKPIRPRVTQAYCVDKSPQRRRVSTTRRMPAPWLSPRNGASCVPQAWPSDRRHMIKVGHHRPCPRNGRGFELLGVLRNRAALLTGAPHERLPISLRSA